MCFLFIISVCDSSATPIFNNNILQSSVFDYPYIKATIMDTKKKIREKHTLESDFNRIMFLVLPCFLEYNSSLVFVPEVWTEHQSNGMMRCDGLAYYVKTAPGSDYGEQDNRILYEGKNITAIS